MNSTGKRPADVSRGKFPEDHRWTKKQKKRNYFRGGGRKTISPGDAGIFVTCNRKMEPRCVGEMSSLFREYANKLYGEQDEGEDNQDEAPDVDDAIQAELQEKEGPKEPLFSNIRLDSPCLVFFKTRPPIEPVSFVRTICSEAASTSQGRTRFAKRLTPISLQGYATEEGLQHVAKKVLAPHFHDEPVTEKKFAIRPTVRDHTKGLTRDCIIKTVADLVGKRHRVDLKNYDFLVLVEVYKNVCGMSVVGSEYEGLKRYNLAEIYEPTSKSEGKVDAIEGLIDASEGRTPRKD